MSENPILDELVYNSSSGALRYKGVRYLMIRPETIADLQKAMRKSFGEKADENIFQGGYTGGCLSTQKYKAIHNASNREIIEFMMNMGNQIGWGNFSLVRYNPDLKILRVCVAHSPFAESYGKSTRSVCHLIRGVLAGMASTLFGSNCTSDEIECRAKGDARCLFVTEGK